MKTGRQVLTRERGGGEEREFYDLGLMTKHLAVSPNWCVQCLHLLGPFEHSGTENRLSLGRLLSWEPSRSFTGHLIHPLKCPDGAPVTKLFLPLLSDWTSETWSCFTPPQVHNQ